MLRAPEGDSAKGSVVTFQATKLINGFFFGGNECSQNIFKVFHRWLCSIKSYDAQK